MDVESGTRGFVRFDDLESRRFSYIGALLPPDPAEAAPQGGQPGWIARGYAYDPARPHAVSGLTVNGEQTAAYEYDQNGNMTCRLEDGLTYKQTYNAENRISGIHKLDGDCQTGTSIESWLYTYDGDGVRIGEYYFVGLTLTLEKTYLFGGAYEYQSDDVVRKYYAIAGQVVAVRTVSAADSTLHYILTDHLGSTSAILDETGTLINQQRYLPFGQPRADVPTPFAAPTDFGYTGQRDLSGTGLMDYRARFYSPALGRFIQPDTLIPGAGDPQAWNRYSYVLNSPVRYSDPSGHAAECGTQAGTSCAGVGPKQPTLVLDQAGIGVSKASGVPLENVVNGVNNAWEFTTTVYSFILEPVDWVVTGYRCLLQGECSAWMAVGLLPFVPSSVGNRLDDLVDVGRTVDNVADAGKGYNSFSTLKKALGNPGIGMEWHHIVEQSQILKSGFARDAIQNADNVIAVSADVHRKISGFYSSNIAGPGTKKVRDWLAGQSYEAQYDFGLKVLRDFGVIP